MEMLHRTDQCW